MRLCQAVISPAASPCRSQQVGYPSRIASRRNPCPCYLCITVGVNIYSSPSTTTVWRPCNVSGILMITRSTSSAPEATGGPYHPPRQPIKPSRYRLQSHITQRPARTPTMTRRLTLKFVTPSTTLATTYSFSFAPSSSLRFLSSLTRTRRGGDLTPRDQMAWLSPGDMRTSLTPMVFCAKMTTALMALGASAERQLGPG